MVPTLVHQTARKMVDLEFMRRDVICCHVGRGESRFLHLIFGMLLAQFLHPIWWDSSTSNLVLNGFIQSGFGWFRMVDDFGDTTILGKHQDDHIQSGFGILQLPPIFGKHSNESRCPNARQYSILLCQGGYISNMYASRASPWVIEKKWLQNHATTARKCGYCYFVHLCSAFVDKRFRVLIKKKKNNVTKSNSSLVLRFLTIYIWQCVKPCTPFLFTSK